MADSENFELGDRIRVPYTDAIANMGQSATGWSGRIMLAQGEEYVAAYAPPTTPPADGIERFEGYGAHVVSSMNHIARIL